MFHDQWQALQQQAEDGGLDFYCYVFSDNPQVAGGHPTHRHLARLNIGSKLSMDNHNGKVVLKDQDRIVATVSKQGAQLWSAKIGAIESVTVLAMIRRYRDDSEESYRSRCKVEQWELPLVEVVFNDRP